MLQLTILKAKIGNHLETRKDNLLMLRNGNMRGQCQWDSTVERLLVSHVAGPEFHPWHPISTEFH